MRRQNAGTSASRDPQVDTQKYDGILLGYGLCNNGTRDLHAPIPLVIPKAHDCITLLLGSKENTRAFFDKNPGTYYLSPGWIERNTDKYEGEQSIPQQLGIASYEEYVAKYGEEDAQYIMETLGGGLQQYTKIAYIDSGVGDFSRVPNTTPPQGLPKTDGSYEKLTGGSDLLQKLMDGDSPPLRICNYQTRPGDQTHLRRRCSHGKRDSGVSVHR